MSDPLILKRCMAAIQAKYILTDDEAKGMASVVLGVASALWDDPPRPEQDDRGTLNENKTPDIAAENERLRAALIEAWFQINLRDGMKVEQARIHAQTRMEIAIRTEASRAAREHRP